ncbi:MAG: V-type ATPase subunit [Clostridia bacterium]|nr:V-type ATPase subunit [Clostridia bacterium]
MKKTDYAYCVARLRANEAYMLKKDFLMKLCESENLDKALSALIEEGWIKEKTGIREIIRLKNNELWTLLNESVPDKGELNVFCVLNDFFNIKTAVKCAFCDAEPENYYLYPTSLNLGELTERARLRDFSSLKIYGAATAEKAYNMALITENGQSAEILIDRGAIDCLCEYAAAKKSELSNTVCGFLCDTANIKIALRINALGKGRDFAEEAIGNTFKLDRNRLINLALGEREELYSYLLATVYSEGVSLYSESTALYEKWCDDRIIDLVSDAKYTAFGFDPVCAFYYGKQNEIKSVSIILTALQSGVAADEIKERVRALYV